MFEQIYARDVCVCVCVHWNFCQLKTTRFLPDPSLSLPLPYSVRSWAGVCVFSVLHLNFAFAGSVSVYVCMYVCVHQTVCNCLQNFVLSLFALCTFYSHSCLVCDFFCSFSFVATAGAGAAVAQYSKQIYRWTIQHYISGYIHLHSKAAKLMQTIWIKARKLKERASERERNRECTQR